MQVEKGGGWVGGFKQSQYKISLLTLHPTVHPACSGGWEGPSTLVTLYAVVVVGPVAPRTGTPLEGTATLHTLLGHLGVELATLHALPGGHETSGENCFSKHLRGRWSGGGGGVCEERQVRGGGKERGKGGERGTREV